jgi:hypothetical protein
VRSFREQGHDDLLALFALGWPSSVRNAAVYDGEGRFISPRQIYPLRDGTIEQIVKASVVRQFLLEVFGEPEKG